MSAHDAANDLPLGRQIQIARDRKGWSQEELAERIGMSQETVSLIERKPDVTPRPATLRRLAEALDLNLTDLLVAAEVVRTKRDAERLAAVIPGADESMLRIIKRVRSIEWTPRREEAVVALLKTFE